MFFRKRRRKTKEPGRKHLDGKPPSSYNPKIKITPVIPPEEAMLAEPRPINPGEFPKMLKLNELPEERYVVPNVFRSPEKIVEACQLIRRELSSMELVEDYLRQREQSSKDIPQPLIKFLKEKSLEKNESGRLTLTTLKNVFRKNLPLMALQSGAGNMVYFVDSSVLSIAHDLVKNGYRMANDKDMLPCFEGIHNGKKVTVYPIARLREYVSVRCIRAGVRPTEAVMKRK